MNENWYIWYELYEDGKPLAHSRGRYHRPYKYKSSAERRARQMWSKGFIDPRTGGILTHKWIISQTNPWEDLYFFATKSEAENLILVMRIVSDRQRFVTREFVKIFVGIESNWLDTKHGWAFEDIKDIRPIKLKNRLFMVELPTPKVVC